jgi:glycosyl transferase, family 25
MKIFVITIKRNQERLNFLSARLRNLGLDFEAIEGIDGANISDDEARKIDTSFYFERYGIRMSKYEVAAALSHRRVYEHMIKNKVNRALILEDDAYPLSSTPEILKSLEQLCNYDLLYLFHGKAKKFPIYKSLPHNYRLYRYLHPSKKSRRSIIYGVAYILTLKGAHKLLEIGGNKMMPPDFLIGLLQLHGLTTFGVEPNCFDHGLFATSTFDRAG